MPVRSDAEAREYLRAWVPEYVEAGVGEGEGSVPVAAAPLSG
jgi:hypothetical protein